MSIVIKNRYTGSILGSGEYKFKFLRDAVVDSKKNLREANLCEADLSRADLFGADLCGADLRRANLSWANLCGADLRRADLFGADLCEANLCGANLCGADLRRADLSGADLFGADLYEADLCGADLRRADLSGALVFIYASNHPMQYNTLTEELRIGCHVHHIEYWLIMYDVIGRENNYTPAEIAEYHSYIRILKAMSGGTT